MWETRSLAANAVHLGSTSCAQKKYALDKLHTSAMLIQFPGPDASLRQLSEKLAGVAGRHLQVAKRNSRLML